AASETKFAFEIGLRGGSVTYRDFALPLVNVNGDLLVTNDGVAFTGFSANLANAPESASVEVPLLEKRPGGSFVVAVALKNLPLDEAFRSALPESVASIYNVIRPEELAPSLAKERADAAEESRKAGKIPSAVNPLANTISGEITLNVGNQGFSLDSRLVLEEVDLQLGVVFEKASGVIEQHVTIETTPASEGQPETSTQTLKGSMFLDSVEWQKIAFEDVTTGIQFFEGRFVMPNIRAKLYDGNVRASIELDTSGEETKYAGRVRATRVQLGPLASAVFGEATIDPKTGEQMSGGVDTELEFASPNERGFIGSGRLDLGRVPLSAEELTPEGQAKLSPDERGGRVGTIGRVPLFSGLYEALSISAGEHFNEAHLYFHLYDRYLEIRQMQMLSDGLAVETKGENFVLFEPDKNGNQFDLTLVPVLFPRSPSIPGVNIVFDAIKGLVLRVYVTGPMDAPVVQALSKRRYEENEEAESERVPTPFDEERKRKEKPDRVRPEYSPWR
ncbi:MAG: hypothetical protein KDB07_02615, partial [Planctomycetes bacterium]|nr:hypothetical protein [Planctomycetota bacterium]